MLWSDTCLIFFLLQALIIIIVVRKYKNVVFIVYSFCNNKIKSSRLTFVFGESEIVHLLRDKT